MPPCQLTRPKNPSKAHSNIVILLFFFFVRPLFHHSSGRNTAQARTSALPWRPQNPSQEARAIVLLNAVAETLKPDSPKKKGAPQIGAAMPPRPTPDELSKESRFHSASKNLPHHRSVFKTAFRTMTTYRHLDILFRPSPAENFSHKKFFCMPIRDPRRPKRGRQRPRRRGGVSAQTKECRASAEPSESRPPRGITILNRHPRLAHGIG